MDKNELLELRGKIDKLLEEKPKSEENNKKILDIANRILNIAMELKEIVQTNEIKNIVDNIKNYEIAKNDTIKILTSGGKINITDMRKKYNLSLRQTRMLSTFVVYHKCEKQLIEGSKKRYIYYGGIFK